MDHRKGNQKLMAIRHPRISLKRLTPETFDMVYQEIRNYIYNSNELKRLEIGSVAWIKHKKDRDTNYNIIQTTSGLDDRKLQDLIAGRTTMATYWLSDGSLRRETLR